MRILQLCLSPGHGGLELYVARLCRLLHERGYACSAVVAPGTMLAERLAAQGTQAAELRVSARLAPLLAARRLARLIERDRIDVLHLHWSKDLPLAALTKRLCRRAVHLVHTRHMRITRLKRDAFHRFQYRSLDAFLVLTQAMRIEAERYLPLEPGQLRLLYLGVPQPPRAAPASEGSDSFRIGLFGRVERTKGQHLLIEAIGRLRTQGMPLSAQIVGHTMDPRYRHELEERVQVLGLQDSITFVPFHPQPMELMLGCDAIVLATSHETFGLVLVEAMRCGVAVIGTDAGGVREIIAHGETGLMFDPGSADALAAQLAFLSEHPQARRDLAQRGQAFADTHFSEQAHIDRLIAIYRDLGGPPPPNSGSAGRQTPP